jgi:hypothetical protein
MPDNHQRPNPLALHVRAAARPEEETDRLLAHLVETCWPGTTADRSEPVARGWLRTWGPVRFVVDVPRCRCDRGHCRICN